MFASVCIRFWTGLGHAVNGLSPCAHIVLPTADLRLNGLSRIMLRLIRAQWLCIILEPRVTQNQSAVICKTSCMCWTGPDRTMWRHCWSLFHKWLKFTNLTLKNIITWISKHSWGLCLLSIMWLDEPYWVNNHLMCFVCWATEQWVI